MKNIEKTKFNFKINIDKIGDLYYSKVNRTYIEIFTIKEYNKYQELYLSNNINDNEEKYNLENINNPHDKIFRKALDKKKNAAEIINTFLKEENRITAEEIQKYNSSYISEELRNSEADVVYKAKDEDVFFLIEQQTKIDYSMPYRILKYELSIINSVLIDRKQKYINKQYSFPLIIPIVLYIGKQKWNVKLDLRHVQLKWRDYKGQELSRYNVIDINEISNNELLEKDSFISKLILMEKSKTEDEFIQNFIRISKELKRKDIYTKEERRFFSIAVREIIKNQFHRKELPKLEKLLKEFEKEGGEKSMMQVIEMLNEEREKLRINSIIRGKEEGIKQGLKQGKIETIKSMIKEKMPMELIIKIMGMTEDEINKIINEQN